MNLTNKKNEHNQIYMCVCKYECKDMRMCVCAMCMYLYV